MFSFFILISLVSFEALAGHPSHNVPGRSRIYGRQMQDDSNRNLTTRNAPQSKGGPMTLVDKYSGTTFFDQWDFFTGPDPTHGLVQYLSKSDATAAGLATVGSDNVVVIAVDDTTTVPSGGNRNSVRITSQKTYTGGLFVMDVNAMPTGCSTWPAFWTVAGANWPQNGEIDIVEGSNNQVTNQMTLHTAPGCTLDTSAQPGTKFFGNVLSPTCDATVASNAGCGISDPDPTSYGAGVNNNGGAVYAMLWDSLGVRVWHFNRTNTPSDIGAFAPNPSAWPIPSAFWSTSTCSVNQFFGTHNIVINTSLCGDLAGGTYPTSGCPGTCADAVADPNNFHNAKWKINYVATYQ